MINDLLKERESILNNPDFAEYEFYMYQYKLCEITANENEKTYINHDRKITMAVYKGLEMRLIAIDEQIKILKDLQ